MQFVFSTESNSDSVIREHLYNPNLVIYRGAIIDRKEIKSGAGNGTTPDPAEPV